MNGALAGRLTVTPSQVAYIADTTAAYTSGSTTLRIVSSGTSVFESTDLVGARVAIRDGTATDSALYGCTGTVSSYASGTKDITLDAALNRPKDGDCATTAVTTNLRIYFGKSSFIAKLGRDGRTIW